MRRRVAFVFGLMASLAACTTVTTVSTTTTSTSTTTSTTSTTTTTTIPATTTTTLAPTTTILLEGNWAAVPVVTSSTANMTLGWWDGSAWVDLREGDEIPVEGGEDYQVVLEGASGVVQGSEQVQGCDVLSPSDFPGIQLSDPAALSRHIEEDDVGRGAIFGVAISAGWELRPRPVTDGESHPDLEALALGLLEERGFATEAVEIVQAIDADIDGDGVIETFLVAEETELGNEMSDVYSILFAVSPSWDAPEVIADSVIPADDTGFPESYRVSAIADLSGDGLMEVVVDALAWENSWVTVYELTDSGFEARIEAGCGV